MASSLLLAASIFLSLGGVAAFILLFALDFNVYWLILSPVILALYQMPAVFVYWLWKRKKRPLVHEKPSDNGPPIAEEPRR